MDAKISIKLLFFAKARELVGKNEEAFCFTGGSHTQNTLLDEIINAYEVLQPISKNLLLALNEEYVDSSQTVYLKDGDVIAVMPPLSGG